MLTELYLPARMPVSQVLMVWPVTMLAGILAATFAVAWPNPIDRGVKLLLLAALGYLPAFVLMGKGWTYHALPFVMFGLIGFLVQFSLLRTGAPLLAKAGVAAGLCLTGFVAIHEHANVHGWMNVYQRPELREAAASIEHALKQPSVASIATRFQPAHPLTRMIDGSYRSRYPSLWMVENAEQLIHAEKNDRKKIARLEMLRDGFIEDSARDIERDRPEVIFDGGSEATPGQRLIHESPAMTRVLAGYQLLYQDKVMTVFIRSDLASGVSVGGLLPPS